MARYLDVNLFFGGFFPKPAHTTLADDLHTNVSLKYSTQKTTGSTSNPGGGAANGSSSTAYSPG